MKESFVLHLNQYAPIQGLSLEQKGMLLDAVFLFNMGEEVSFSDPVVGMAFAFFRASFERNNQKYQDVVSRNRENGKKGGRPGKPSGMDRVNENPENPENPLGFSEPKKADSDSDSDSEEEERNTFSASASPDAAHEPDSEPSKPEIYITKKKRKLTGKRLQAFTRFWTAFAYARGKAEAADTWLDIPELTNALVEIIIAAAEREAAARPGLVASGHTPKMAQGWLSGRRWEDGAETVCREKTLDELLAEQGIMQ